MCTAVHSNTYHTHTYLLSGCSAPNTHHTHTYLCQAVGGYTVPAGHQLCVSPTVNSRLQEVWDDPNHFNPDRYRSLLLCIYTIPTYILTVSGAYYIMPHIYTTHILSHRERCKILYVLMYRTFYCVKVFPLAVKIHFRS